MFTKLDFNRLQAVESKILWGVISEEDLLKLELNNKEVVEVDDVDDYSFDPLDV